MLKAEDNGGGCLMSLEENKALIRSLYEADNKKDLSILDELISPDFVDPTFHLRGPESYKQFETLFFRGFPDWQETIEDIVAEADTVWVRFTGTGTHRGEWRGLAPTGTKITFHGVQIWRIADGKVVEKASIIDLLDALKQLGVIEYTEKAKTLFPEDVS
jgi:predicted ester cyclase